MTSHCTEFVFVCVLLLTKTEFLNSKFICPTQVCMCFNNTWIDCTNKGLKTIPKFAPSNTSFYTLNFFEDPRYIYKNTNNISTLYMESFKNITVEKIDLRSARLTHIDSKAFAGVENFLKFLYIESDGTTVVNLPFLKGLVKLELLHLENFGLTDVSEDNHWKELTNLMMITVKNCINLTSLGNNTFVNMPNLTMVYLENLPSLQTVPTAIQNLQSLMYLKIYKTSVSHLNENSFKGLTKLQILDLSKNYLQFFEHNTFTDIHETLKYLDLSLNNLSASALSPLTNIKWMTLRTLNLSQNPLINLPEGFFYNMSTLGGMILNQCNMSKIQNITFSGLGKLTTIDISMNEIVDVEVGSFLPTPNLTHLDLHDQHQVLSCHLLHSSGYPPLNLPHEALWHLRFYLTHLDLGYNLLNLTDTYQLIRSLSNLKVIGLKCIGLEEIPSYLFSNHSHLQILYLDDNNLKTLSPETLYGLSGSLRELYLNNNKLKTLYKCVLENFTQLQKLELKGNEWICDCHFIWLFDRIYNGSFKKNFLKCTTPAEYKSLYLITLFRKMLVCSGDYFESDCPIWFDINITTLSQTSLQVTWSVNDNYILSGYQLEVMNLQNRNSTRNIFQADMKSYTLIELEPETPYQICLLIMISEKVKANLEACKTWEIQGPSSSKETHQGQSTSTTIIFKSLAIIGAVAFIIIVLAITVILNTVPRKKANNSMQLVLTQQCDSGCTTEETFPKSSCSSDSSDAHFLKHNDNKLSIYPELTSVEQEKLRERCKHLLSNSSENDVQITNPELLRSANISKTEGLQTGSSIIYTEVDTSLNPFCETWDNDEETIKSLLFQTNLPQDTETVCQTTEMYSEINEPAMVNAITGKGSKSDIPICNKTESMTKMATLTSLPVHLVASKQRSFNVYTDIPASKKMEKKKTKVGGLKTWRLKKRSKSNEGLMDKEAQDEGVGQYVHLSDSESLHKKYPDAELTPTNNIKSNNKSVPKISQKTKLYFKPTKSESDDNAFNTFS
ncbi:hypothetical protein CHS0354_003134 [Potamilus streckersoni]|uniref:Fibronectin type-III domain-containing protein n=1 Tax=Potamilus streckersoni TaxID=2493646 RepID=A0AAE0VHH3_9BIVA|nr:hypothetical protein CHS0354_003134 [Potamilus streckersoni]